MNLSAYIAKLLEAQGLSVMLTTAISLPPPACTSEEAKATYHSLSGHIASNDHANAAASMLALLRLDSKKWLARMRKDGLFRASRYGYKDSCLKKIVGLALELPVATHFLPEQTQYLQSVQTLLKLAQPARQVHRSIVDRLKSLKGRGLKTLLAHVNSTFSIDLMGIKQADENSPMYWSATDLASAFSRLYMISRDEIGIGTQAWTWTDDHGASKYEWIYSSLLVDALRLNELVDAEVLLDGLPYKAEVTSAGVLISAIDPELERSVRLGYIQSDLQLLTRVHSSLHFLGREQSKSISFQEALSPFITAGLLECVWLKKEPIERFVFAFPSLPPLIDLLNFDGAFLEEFPLLVGSLIDNFQPPEKNTLQVAEHLWITDLFKAQRVFNLIDTLFRKKMDTVDDAVRRRMLGLRSTVIVMARMDLQRTLEVVMSTEKAQELISLLLLPTANSTAGDNAYIDLQYRPFVQSLNPKGDYIAIPPAIVGKSNLVRSIMHTSGIKEATNAADDPMQVAVAAALRTAGFLVRESFVFNINGRRETDIFCYRDGVLFVIECKNAYHPCSPHELRNSYDLILKAEDQLDIRTQWLAEPRNQERLVKALGWETVVTPALVYSCVVTANRAFSGYRCGAHPVRQAHELINVLLRGYIGRGPENSPQRFWNTETFEVGDLIDYLEGKSILQTQHGAMVPHRRGINLKERRLEFAQFVMDMPKMDLLLNESFAVVGGSATETP
ncbi:hypothetical protein CTTA_5077 [Comamonas testosteroni]|uniref:NERD domain-containing protein n=1 Tax=Comamonas testosteroni TaxID=285 RepID=A0A5A7MK78_COMTE|nr:endonuclease [Comamonas testosteroni]GEQ78072.1 hypothetical protein CTTA_5077 [Comamonas testosteroni]